MKQITDKEYNSLKDIIFNTLIAQEGVGMGEIGECYDESDRIIDEWMEDNGIELEGETEVPLVVVNRIIPIFDDPYFQVIWVENGRNKYKHFNFHIGAKEDDIYNEELNRLKAMEVAAKVGNQSSEKIETIYQTPQQ